MSLPGGSAHRRTAGGGRRPRYNVAPTQMVVTVTDDGERWLGPRQQRRERLRAVDPAAGVTDAGLRLQLKREPAARSERDLLIEGNADEAHGEGLQDRMVTAAWVIRRNAQP